MLFSNLLAVANYIKRNHFLFADGFISDTLSVLGNMNAAIESDPAMIGATFEAWQDVTGYGELKTLITINKLPSGVWEVTERTA